jgi:hypothetical protein
LSRRREQDVIELPNGARQLRRPVIQQQQEMIYGNCRNYSSNLNAYLSQTKNYGSEIPEIIYELIKEIIDRLTVTFSETIN